MSCFLKSIFEETILWSDLYPVLNLLETIEFLNFSEIKKKPSLQNVGGL